MMANKLALLSTVDTVFAIEPGRGEGYRSALESMDISAGAEMASVAGRSTRAEIGEMARAGNGILHISVVGPLTKAMTSATWMFGGTSTLEIRRMLAAARTHQDVKAVFLYFDSPGGQSSGTEELARDVAKLAAEKPVLAFVSDCCCSAAYWVASQAPLILAEPGSGAIGSIGTYLVVKDTSVKESLAGVETLVFATGPIKGAGIGGSKVTDAQREYFQAVADRCQARFAEAVQSGRGLDSDAYSKVSDGRTWNAAEAESLGLIDGTASEEEAYNILRSMVDARERKGAASSAAEGTKNMDQNQQNGKPSLVERIRGMMGAGSGTPAAAAPDPASEVAEVQKAQEAEIARLRAGQNALLESRLEADANAFAEKLVFAGKIVPAMREKVAESYVKAVIADSPSGLSASADGSVAAGETLAAVTAAFESMPAMQLTKEQVPASTDAVTVLPSDKKPDAQAEVDSFLSLSATGRRALSARGRN